MPRGKRYSDDFKKNAVKMVLVDGNKKSEVAKHLGIHLNTLTTWINNYQESNKDGISSKDLEKRLRELEKQKAELEEENEILKKAAAFFAKNQK